ncbi:dihydrolipoyl dehydrogenase [Brevibacillus reuszeri]|uniref:Dihydrolipoyl dehydrogenase n=1 Tax=Brevibacillus reuszeri TaxID=54915 RepID=A0A0K9Z2T5_9BACL|nr:dihydrolipoyl dehydrogenase [Brevibacillus reuszeri]KNB74780.1 acetoin dehydrogenase [Brevibacillus reuszeri]MED1859574.1 dihydrolipoyl dehydrogenase [Brevibacillus reuszeri]GED71926.1 dihydrolipoyl dehydrogenase [Brevibacillus reuszeri]
MQTYDIAVIGGGPAGYVAAIRASKEGKRVALIEADFVGGTCLNRGCIPSKTLLHSAGVIDQIRQASSWGIETGEVTVSLEKMMARKNQVITQLRTGIKALLKAGKIDLLQGFGEVNADKSIRVRIGEDVQTIQAGSIILATGSTPAVPPIPGLADVPFYTSDTIFDIEQVPESITILGGGFIGVEFACIFASLGAKVMIVEMAERLIPLEDADASRVLSKSLRSKGVTLGTGLKVTSVAQTSEGIQVHAENTKGDTQTISCEALLVAVGRKPNLSAFSQLNVELSGPFVKVNEFLETSVPGIFAAGDLIGGWQLAHAASAEGQTAAINAAGGREKVNDRAVPRCIYTHPEISSVGLSEEEAKARGYAVKTSVYQHSGNGKALASDENGGFTKLIAEETYGEVLGIVMVGPHVTEMIAAGTAFLSLEATVDDVAEMIYPHPTVSESLMEVAAKWLGKGIHS